MQDKKAHKFYEYDRPELVDKLLVYFGFHLDGSHIVGVYDSNLIDQVLRDPELFRRSPITYEAIKFALGSGIATSEDEPWAVQRRILAPLFNNNQLTQNIEIVIHRTMDTLNKISTHIAQNEGKQQSLHKKIFNETTQAIMNSYCFGDRFDAGEMSERWMRVVAAFIKFWAGRLIFGDIFSSVPVPSNLSFFREISGMRKEIQEIIEEKKKLNQSHEDKQNIDLISSLLRSSKKEPIANEVIIDNVLSFLFAGNDTTANAISWIFLNLAEHQEIQEKVFVEVDKILGDRFAIGDFQLKMEDLDKLIFIRKVVLEALRLNPPVRHLERVVAQDTKLGSVYLPKGTSVVLMLYNGQLREKQQNPYCNMSNPLEFNPNRWDSYLQNEGANSSALSTPNFLAFSLGKRNCLGQKLALVEMIIIVALITWKFKYRKDESSPVHVGVEGTVAPVGLKLFFETRQK